METAAADIRESLLSTLRFLASGEEQRRFASNVPYQSYHDELACWWFDTFGDGQPTLLPMFSSGELRVLQEFSQRFRRNLELIGDADLTLQELQQRHEWQAVVADAQTACAEFERRIT